MSGGSHNYAYSHAQDFAESLEADAQKLEDPNTDPLRIAFAAHLRLVAKAMHDIEWVDSFDKAKGDEHAAIRAVLEKS